MKNIKTAIRLIAVHLGLTTHVTLGAFPVAGRKEHPMTRSRVPRWTAFLVLLIAPVAAPVMALETGTITVTSTLHMDWLSGTVGPDLAEVYANGHEHAWTLTLHGTTQSHQNFSGIYFATEIHAMSFDLEFSGPDATTLNAIVSEHVSGGDISIYLQNAYTYGGGDFAVMHVWLMGSDMYFYSGHDMGVKTLFPTDAYGYPVLGPEPFSIWSDFSQLWDGRPGLEGQGTARRAGGERDFLRGTLECLGCDHR